MRRDGQGRGEAERIIPYVSWDEVTVRGKDETGV